MPILLPSPVQSISEGEAVRLLSSLNHAAPVTFSALTIADTLPGAPEVWKLSSVSAFTGCHYAASVNRQALREGRAEGEPFQSQPRKWGERVRPALVSHKGAHYLPAHVLAARPVYLMVGEDGLRRIVSRETVAPYLRKPEPPRSQGGLDRPIIYRDYSLANLVSLSLNRRRYRITHPTARATAGESVKPATVTRPKPAHRPRRELSAADIHDEAQHGSEMGWDAHKTD